MEISNENRKIIKHLISILWWYLLGFVEIQILMIHTLPLNKDFAFFFGWFVDISVILLIIANLIDINEAIKCKSKKFYEN